MKWVEFHKIHPQGRKSTKMPIEKHWFCKGWRHGVEKCGKVRKVQKYNKMWKSVKSAKIQKIVKHSKNSRKWILAKIANFHGIYIK